MNPPAFLTLALAVALASSCARLVSKPPLYTVAELVPRIDALNGQTVRVAGYLEGCFGYDCELYPRQADAAVRGQALANFRATRRWQEPNFPILGIGDGEGLEFDAKAAPFAHRYVTITGRVTNQCRYHGEQSCTDRTTDIEPTGVEPWTGPGPPPPQSGRTTA